MIYTRGKQSILWLMFVTLLSSCASGPGLQETKKKVDTAGKYIEVLNQSEVKSDDVRNEDVARTAWESAVEHLRRGEIRDAYNDAMMSIQAAEPALLDIMKKKLQQTQAEFKAIQAKDPAAPVDDVLTAIDTMLAQVDQVQQAVGRGESVPILPVIVTIQDYLGAVGTIYTSEKLQSNVSFGSGQYELSVQGQVYVEEIVDKITAKAEAILNKAPEKPVTIAVNVYGYTDQIPIKGKDLIKRLTDDVADIPQIGTVQYQRFLNQRLSALRAKTVSERLEELLTSKISSDSQISLQRGVVLGKGEELPPDVPQNGLDDPQRRICQIHIYVKGGIQTGEVLAP